MPETYNDQQQQLSQHALALGCLIVVLILSAVLYAKIGTSHGYLDDTNDTEDNLKGDNNGDNLTDDIVNKTHDIITGKIVIRQPGCPPQDKNWELNVLCAEFLIAKMSCRPEDISDPLKHKIPKFYYQHSVKNNSNNNDTQNTIVNCIIAILLLSSLGAALLEFYRAKISPSPENGKKGAKAPLNRKCSLADLTVLKHHRKELVRRESILEHHLDEEGENNHQQHQGSTKPSPLHRRGSFPASLPYNNNDVAAFGGGGFPAVRRNSRKMSMTGELGRRMSIVNAEGGRKLSMVVDEGVWRRGSIAGEDCSPDRRVHHSRLVHRH